ncbi:MAG: ATP-binding protein [Candidatus Dojkabacteria bacterium]|nr:ATP-binding protein [Candidatus Dojkabacteria bacterium]
MKTVAVTGGKGGTGKSTVAIILALREIEKSSRVLLVDADVECPNDHILLGISTPKNLVAETYAYYPKIDESKCTGCGLCVRSCKSAAMFQAGRKIPTINEDLCSSCGVCWNICPSGAISKKPKINGEIFESKVGKYITLLTGRSIPGVRETSPVVKQLRDYVNKISKSYDTVIIDTAAGSHCSVISALEGVDEAYAVTEPTPLGSHDLNVILKVLHILKIPAKVIINKSGIGDEKGVVKIAEENKIDISGRIMYSSKLARVYSEGNLLNSKKMLTGLLGNKT